MRGVHHELSDATHVSLFNEYDQSQQEVRQMVILDFVSVNRVEPK